MSASMIGSVVTVRQLPGITWVIRQVDGDGRLHLRTRDGNRYSGRVCGAGDVSVITPPPTYAVGTHIEHDNMDLTVLEDRGDDVVFTVGDVRWVWRDNTSLRIPGGNGYTVNKGDLVVEALP